jgi:hypothetical protein
MMATVESADAATPAGAPEKASRDPIRSPSALVPIAMSLAALGLVLGHAAIYGVTRETDEGTAAHVFQLLMAGQLPIVAWFAVRHFPRRPKCTLKVLTLQAIVGLAAIAAVLFLT